MGAVTMHGLGAGRVGSPFIWLAFFWLLLAQTAAAALPVQGGVFTNLTGSRERLISYRQQERFWITSDGIRHLLINRGADYGDGLHLMRRSAGLTQWRSEFSLPGGDRTSTADGVLLNGHLHLVYSDAAGAIRYARADYDEQTGQWQPLQTSSVYDGGAGVARAPTLAIDAEGRVWVAFTVAMTANDINVIRVVHSLAPLQAWQDTGRHWGAANTAQGKAGRLINSAGQIGLIYTDIEESEAGVMVSLRWSLLLELATNSWADELIDETPISDKDPFGTHFSALTDEAGNLHLVWPIGGRLRYFRYDAAGERWNYRRWLLALPTKTAYAQLARHLDGRLYVIFNLKSMLMVMLSRDGGFVFEPQVLLVHPMASFVDWSRPRVESPAVFADKLDILQQVHLGEEDGGFETLFAFELAP